MAINGLVCFCLLLGVFSATSEPQEGYQVLRTTPIKDGVDLKTLLRNPNYDILSPPRLGRVMDVMTSLKHVDELRDEMIRLGLKPTLNIADVNAVLAKERDELKKLKLSSKSSEGRASIDNTQFHTLEEIHAYLDAVALDNPSIASVFEIGQSTERNPLKVLKLSNGPGKAGMFIDAAMNAREWMGVSVVLDTIIELTDNLNINQLMLDKNDFYFLPVANPDGYKHTWDTNRAWKKTRSSNPGSSCTGTDGNRNWNYVWGESGIPSPCEDTYPGSSPFSEPETLAISNFLQTTPSITLYLSLDSNGENLMYPWSYTYELPSTSEVLDAVARRAAIAIQNVQGTVYEVGTVHNTRYPQNGSSTDWAMGAINLSHSFTMDLPSGGSLGFNPPPADITRITTETWAAIKVFADSIPTTRG